MQLPELVEDATWVQRVGEAKQPTAKRWEAGAHDHGQVDVGCAGHDAVFEDSRGFVDHRQDQPAADGGDTEDAAESTDESAEAAASEGATAESESAEGEDSSADDAGEEEEKSDD